jgi:hypothetical protein
MENILEELKEYKDHIKQQDKKIKKLEATLKQTTGPIINNNNYNNNKIKLLAFGKEDLHSLSNDVCKKILRKGYQAVPALVEYMHFNKDNPTAHNVFVSNSRDCNAMTYDGDDWILTNKDEIVNKLYDDKYVFLLDKFEELDDELDSQTKKKFGRFKEETEMQTKEVIQEREANGIDCDLKNIEQVANSIKKGLKLLMYNKRKIPLQTKKAMEQKRIKDS